VCYRRGQIVGRQIPSIPVVYDVEFIVSHAGREYGEVARAAELMPPPTTPARVSATLTGARRGSPTAAGASPAPATEEEEE
jgi:hypothetical protein